MQVDKTMWSNFGSVKNIHRAMSSRFYNISVKIDSSSAYLFASGSSPRNDLGCSCTSNCCDPPGYKFLRPDMRAPNSRKLTPHMLDLVKVKRVHESRVILIINFISNGLVYNFRCIDYLNV